MLLSYLAVEGTSVVSLLVLTGLTVNQPIGHQELTPINLRTPALRVCAWTPYIGESALRYFTVLYHTDTTVAAHFARCGHGIQPLSITHVTVSSGIYVNNYPCIDSEIEVRTCERNYPIY